MEKFVCDYCGQEEMTEVARKYAKTRYRKERYRIRHLKCSICDHQVTIYADGFNDLEAEPAKAIDQIKKAYKEEEEARNVK